LRIYLKSKVVLNRAFVEGNRRNTSEITKATNTAGMTIGEPRVSELERAFFCFQEETSPFEALAVVNLRIFQKKDVHFGNINATTYWARRTLRYKEKKKKKKKKWKEKGGLFSELESHKFWKKK